MYVAEKDRHMKKTETSDSDDKPNEETIQFQRAERNIRWVEKHFRPKKFRWIDRTLLWLALLLCDDDDMGGVGVATPAENKKGPDEY